MTEAVKTCLRCGIDCTHDRRYKDADGLYTCGGCYDAQKAGAEARAALRAKYVSKPREPDPEPFNETISLDAKPEDLEAHGLRGCPGCGRSIPVDHLICSHCHYNLSTGKRPFEHTRERACSECGYDLQGLPLETRCPECGTLNDEHSSPRLVRAQRELSRDLFIRAAWYIGAGLAAMVLVELIARQPLVIVIDLIAITLSVIGGFAGYFMFCQVWDAGAEQPWKMALANLAAVFCVAAAIGAVFNALGVATLGFLVGVIVFYGMLTLLFELDSLADAIILSILMNVASIVTTVGLRILAAKMGLLP
jgi:hypothetical protein